MIRVLIIGCGNIAGGFDATREAGAPPLTHAGAYARHGGFSIVGCVDPDAARREAFMRRWAVPQGYASMDEARAAGMRADVVSVCSPTASHYDDVIAALGLSPRLIFCEKPVATSAAATAALAERCAAAGVPLAVNHTRRWDPEVTRLAAELRSGAWGAVRSAIGVYTKGVLNNGSHMIDLLHLLLGRLELRYASGEMHDALADDPSVAALLSAADGATVQLACGNAGDYALFELRLVTEKGVIAMEDGGMRWHTRLAQASPMFAGYRTLADSERRAGGLAQAMLRAAGEIHEFLARGGALSSTVANALEAQKVCEAIRRLAAASPSTFQEAGA